MASRELSHSASGVRTSYVGATFHAPAPPPEPVHGVSGPTYVHHQGDVWRRSAGSWQHLDQDVAPKLLAALLIDAMNTDDWFHARAAELAAELSRAIAEAGTFNQREAA